MLCYTIHKTQWYFGTIFHNRVFLSWQRFNIAKCCRLFYTTGSRWTCRLLSFNKPHLGLTSITYENRNKITILDTQYRDSLAIPLIFIKIDSILLQNSNMCYKIFYTAQILHIFATQRVSDKFALRIRRVIFSDAAFSCAMI